MRKLLAGSVVMLAIAIVGLTSDAVGQPPAKGKATTPVPKSADKAPDKTTDDATTTFEVYKDAGGKFRFRFKHGDENLAMASKGYETKADVMKVIKTIQSDAAKAKIDDQSK